MGTVMAGPTEIGTGENRRYGRNGTRGAALAVAYSREKWPDFHRRPHPGASAVGAESASAVGWGRLQGKLAEIAPSNVGFGERFSR